MVNKMSFASLVESFSVPFTLILPAGDGGHYEDGEWVPDNSQPETKYGAIIPYTDKQVYESGGHLTQSDRQLAYVGNLPLGATVVDMDHKYKIVSLEPYAEHYADTSLYNLKAVSAFE